MGKKDDFRINRGNGSARSFQVEFAALNDPTAGTVEFALQPTTEDLENFDEGTLVAGTWVSYEPKTKRAIAQTPSFGDTVADYDTSAYAAGTHRLWRKVQVGSEIDVLPWDGDLFTLI